MNVDNETVNCSSETLLLHLYDELGDAERAACERHLAACGACRDEEQSLRETLATVERAHLREMATFESPGDWDAIETRLAALPRRGVLARPRLGALARAAGIVLLAGAAFIAGRQWDELRGIAGEPSPGSSARTDPQPTSATLPPSDPAARLKVFSERTNGYLQRSRLLLLEFANADAASDSPALIANSRTLLRENRDARRVAGQIRDARLDALLSDLEETLTQISGIHAGESHETLAALRTRVDGLLGRLELFTTSPPRMAHDRSRA